MTVARGHEQAVRVEYRQGMQQHILIRKAPFLYKNLAVGQYVFMRQHGTLGSPRGSRRIQKYGKVAAVTIHGFKLRGHVPEAIGESSAAVRIQAFKSRAATPRDSL